MENLTDYLTDLQSAATDNIALFTQILKNSQSEAEVIVMDEAFQIS